FLEAIGPGEVGNDTARTGSGQAIFRVGVEADGDVLGVIGNASTTPRGLPPPRRIGVWARGESAGVYSQTNFVAGGGNDHAAAIIGSSSDEKALAAFFARNTAVYAKSGNTTAVVAQSGNGAALQIFRPAAILATSSRNIAVTAVSNTTVAVHAHSGPPHNFGGFKTGAVTATSSGPNHGVQ